MDINQRPLNKSTYDIKTIEDIKAEAGEKIIVEKLNKDIKKYSR